MKLGQEVNIGGSVGRVDGFESTKGGIIVHIFFPAAPEVKIISLDPHPWITLSGVRLSNEEADGYTGLIDFDPRPEYSNKLEDY